MDKYCQFSTPHSCRKHLALYQWEQLSQRKPHSPVWLKLIYPLPYPLWIRTHWAGWCSQAPLCRCVTWHFWHYFQMWQEASRAPDPMGEAGDLENILFWGEDAFWWIKPKIVRMHGSESFSAILEPPRENELYCCYDPAFPFKNTVTPNATQFSFLIAI